MAKVKELGDTPAFRLQNLAPLRNFPPMPNVLPNLLSVNQAAAELNMRPRTLHHWIATGRVAATKIDPDKTTSAYVITRAEVDRLVADAKAAS